MHATETTTRKQQPSIVAQVRAISPRRPLTFTESLHIGEVQAAKLLQLTGCAEGPVPEAIITELPRIDAQRTERLIGSGFTTWSRGQWRIRVKASDPITRQRFTLVHELKHVLDAPLDDVIYRHLPPGEERRRHIEAVCDAFAAAVLMPRSWVKRQWYAGNQEIASLAWLFEVSLQAMHIRLQTIGLIERMPYGCHVFEVGRTAVQGSRHDHRVGLPQVLRFQRDRPHLVTPAAIRRCPHPTPCPGVAS